MKNLKVTEVCILLNFYRSNLINLEADKSKETDRNNKHNTHLHNQIIRYENMLSKMNQEYEKLLFQSTDTDKIIISLRRELNDLKVGSDRKINSLDAQLKVTNILFNTLGCSKRY